MEPNFEDYDKDELLGNLACIQHAMTERSEEIDKLIDHQYEAMKYREKLTLHLSVKYGVTTKEIDDVAWGKLKS